MKEQLARALRIMTEVAPRWLIGPNVNIEQPQLAVTRSNVSIAQVDTSLSD
jgi:hypothetical protein